ncbi:hypothetical protein A2803_04880 [Candidatus Woesebacteria bacterium RIFCSPHIGHO2_01_FULL_44_21]|uniref:Uncharacterized protein n=1 Tax=Candidatus Woesebacteria bacterium RIFCSPHIGHO2_01_FULL_44_21 TaxID=1802503 RepID=A0A1F7Z204_9BACT|nr:MAG: hypothetical protein A2803_04880 [Candidatus Woesebacteria bacterium RIFCSPHIGHO2_01_FULL_44_21]OGM69451.1 MAG: hypothetical protein A2897_03810 [Candidatus Woesebacteria bacterium RIFCSPLOWO2_01_FULL_44_24b]
MAIPDRLQTSEIRQISLELTDPQLVIDLSSLGYEVHIDTVLNKPFFKGISQQREVPLPAFHTDSYILNSLVNMGYKFSDQHIYPANAVKYARGGQWGAINGVINFYPDLGKLLTTNLNPDCLEIIKTGVNNGNSLEEEVEKVLGKAPQKKLLKIPVAVLPTTSIDIEAWAIYVPDSNVAIAQNLKQIVCDRTERASHSAISLQD